jgi:hypothetical protein
VLEALRHVLVEPADAEVAEVHAHAGDRLEDVEQLLALAHGVEEQRQRPHVEDAGAEEDEVAGDAVELGEDHAHALRALGHPCAHELLGAEHVGQVVSEGVDVVHPVRVRDDLLVRAVLHRLLEAGVEVADHGADAGDALAVEVDHEAQHAVGAGVLRTDVDAHELGLEVAGALLARA